jgi:hypothetical protein
MIKNNFLTMFQFATLLLMSALTTQAATSLDTKLFSGSIEFPCNLDYDLCLFYQGQKLEIESNNTSHFVQFSFLDSKHTHTVYLVITNGLTCQTSESNNVSCLSVVDQSSYLCYKLQAKREIDEDEHQLLTWDIEPHNLQGGKIPASSLIFLFEPTLIAGFKVQSWKPENMFRIIPTLLIQPSATVQQIQRAMIIARLAALDIDAIHRKANMNSTTDAILTAMQ